MASLAVEAEGCWSQLARSSAFANKNTGHVNLNGHRQSLLSLVSIEINILVRMVVEQCRMPAFHRRLD